MVDHHFGPRDYHFYMAIVLPAVLVLCSVKVLIYCEFTLIRQPCVILIRVGAQDPRARLRPRQLPAARRPRAHLLLPLRGPSSDLGSEAGS